VKRSILPRLLAPYLAVAVFWIGLSNAWLTILAYHAQILYWAFRTERVGFRLISKPQLLLALPTVLTGPLTFFVLPFLLKMSLSDWLLAHHLSGLSFMLMIPYYGFVHPILEQMHWEPLRRATPWAHPTFAAYHMLVLFTLLEAPWLLFCFAILTAASFLWREMVRHSESLGVPIVSHILADFGMVLAAWFLR